jgi:hypothetical protein
MQSVLCCVCYEYAVTTLCAAKTESQLCVPAVPSGANSLKAGWDIFDTLGKLKVHDSAHNSPQLVPRNI